MTTRRLKGRRALGIVGATVLTGALVSTFGSTATAATTATPYGGFTTSATAIPLRIEIWEPAIPIPAEPQAELNFSYTNVGGASGPDSNAMASAMWPGAAIGNGLPTLLGTFGLPATLIPGGYPVHVNSEFPGKPNSGTQEFIPGMVGRVSSTDKVSSARAGYSTSGEVGGDASNDKTSSLLTDLLSGNLGALGSLLNGPNSTSDTGSNPLGLLSALVSVGGMSASSVTDYSDSSVVSATGTSEIGAVSLLGGLVKLSGVNVTAQSSSSLDGGGKTTQKANYGTLTVAGQSFKLTSDGIEAGGKTTKLPDTALGKLLAPLGISIDLPKPTKKVNGKEATSNATGPVITIDTKPVISLLQLDKLPLGSLLAQIPDSAGQAKGLLMSALVAHPKVIVYLGTVSTSAQTIAALDFGGGDLGGGGGAVPPTGTGGDTGGLGDIGTPGAGIDIGTAPDGGLAPQNMPNTTYPVAQQTTPGLPPLGSVPGLLTIGGLILAAGLGWFFRAAALTALGAGGTCTHGLATGLPDLRKA